MGTDYGAFLQEACRILRIGGFLWIAEVRSRYVPTAGNDPAEHSSDSAFAPFVQALRRHGMQVTVQDSSNKMFVVFEAKKIADEPCASADWPELKPCTYKRR